jgi:predicted nucleic acid-binding protein
LASASTRVYWDACAWIGFINAEPDKITSLRAIWDAAKRGNYQIWTSTFSYLEVIRGINKQGEAYPPEEYDELVYDLFEQPHVERVQLDVEVAMLARKMKRDYHPTLASRADAVHLATALYWNCEELHTYDGNHLLPLDGKIPRRDGIFLSILAPDSSPPRGGLFDLLESQDGPEEPENSQLPPEEEKVTPPAPMAATQPPILARPKPTSPTETATPVESSPLPAPATAPAPPVGVIDAQTEAGR